MAGKTNQVAVEIVAIDEASPKIDKLTKKIEGLESDEARIIVTSNIDTLDRQLTDALAKLHNLDGDEATVQARLVGNLEDDLIAANKLFDQLAGKTGTVTLAASGAAKGIDEIGRSADSSKSALANMIGNTTQDLGALGGLAGSAGVAIGQLGEYAADAALGGERLGSAIGNMVKVAGPIAGLALAVKAINDAVAQQAELNKLAADRQERWNDALDAGPDAAEAWVTALGEVRDLTVDITELPELSPEFTDAGVTFKSFFNILDGGRQTTLDAADAFQKAGINTGDLASAVTLGADAYARFVAGVDAARDAGRISQDEAILIIGLLDQEKTAYDDARVARRKFQQVFDPKPGQLEAATLKAVNTQLERYLEFLTGRGIAAQLDAQAASQAAANRELEEYLRLLVGRHDEAVDEQRVAEATDDHYRALSRLNTEAERVDRAKLLHEEETQARATESQYESLFGMLDERSARLALQSAFARAREQLADTKTTGLEAMTIISDLDLAVARFGQQTGIPEPLVKEVIAKIDSGKLTESEKVILGYIPPKPVVVPIVPVQQGLSSGATADRLERISSSNMPAPANVTIIASPATSDIVVGSLNQFLARNGAR